jgi:hypothetical protein
MTFVLTSTAFAAGGPVPRQYTCDGKNISPPLSWSGAPPGTRSFALICDDPDAPGGTWVHWVLYDVDGGRTALAEGIAGTPTLDDLGPARQGTNDSRRTGYSGPCPPPGKPHRYFFKLYAVDTRFDTGKRTKGDLERAMDGHVLARAELMGTYGRSSR